MDISIISSKYFTINNDNYVLEIFTDYDISGIIRLLPYSISMIVHPIINNSYFVAISFNDSEFIGFIQGKSFHPIIDNEFVHTMLYEKTLIPERIENYVVNYINKFVEQTSNNIKNMKILQFLSFDERIDYKNFHKYSPGNVLSVEERYNYLFDTTYFRVTMISRDERAITTNVSRDDILEFMKIFRNHNKLKWIVNYVVKIDDYFVNYYISQDEFPVFDDSVNPGRIYTTKNFLIGNMIIVDDVIINSDYINYNKDILKLLEIIKLYV